MVAFFIPPFDPIEAKNAMKNATKKGLKTLRVNSPLLLPLMMTETEITLSVFSFPDGSRGNNMSRKGSSKDLNDARNESGADLSQTPSMQKVKPSL